MSDTSKLEKERAHRIGMRMEDIHLAVTDIYEKLVDREFDTVPDKVKTIISDLKMLLKSMEDDDF
jgi:hypothetical protein